MALVNLVHGVSVVPAKIVRGGIHLAARFAQLAYRRGLPDG